jgi:tetratricopeptide (TPR) repeat protein
MLPSLLLGMISPVVAKTALDKGLTTGRTVGDIYAFGAAGSILGTFLAGFYLIDLIGTIATIWAVAAVLLLIAILYCARLWALYIWAVIFIASMTMGIAPAKWAESIGSTLALRKQKDPSILYETESQYCYVAVQQLSQNPDSRIFVQDKLTHSKIIMDDVLNLQYFYSKIYAGITGGLIKDKLSIMVIGGGGYAYPQYVEKRWPGSRIDVVEIDPAVTEAAIQAFGLDRNSSINTIYMDARNYVDELLNKQSNGEMIPKYNFIYEDAFNDYSLPFQLVTREFNDKIAKILTDNGVYMINLIEIFDSGLFLGAMINTLEKTFPYVHVLVDPITLPTRRQTYVVVAAKHYFEPENILSKYGENLKLRILNESEKNNLKEKAGGVVLTDDYAPVENLLAPVVRESVREKLALEYIKKAMYSRERAKWNRSITMYEKAIHSCPLLSAELYNEMGNVRCEQGEYEEGIRYFEKALSINPGYLPARQNICSAFLAQKKLDEAVNCYSEALQERNDWPNMEQMYHKLGWAYEQKGDFILAEKNYRKALVVKPDYIPSENDLGRVLAKQGKLDEAVTCFNGLLMQKEDSVEAHSNLALVLSMQGKYDEAVKHFARVLELNPKYPDGHERMGELLIAAGKPEEAVEHLNEALQTSAGNSNVYAELGTAYNQLGKYDLAIQDWTKAIELAPDNADVLNDAAWLLATVSDESVRDADKAIEFAGRACEITWGKNPGFLDTLAAAYAAAGRFGEAVKTAEQAVDIADADGQKDLSNEIQQRLKLYQAGQPYRQKL